MIIRRAFTLILLLISFEQESRACTLAGGSEDPTTGTMRIAMSIFLAGLLVGGAHLAVFIYRKGHNGWVFWSSFALSLIVIPISLLLMMMAAGTACGQGSIEIAGFTLAFQLAALAVQLFSWKFSDVSYRLTIPRD